MSYTTKEVAKLLGLMPRTVLSFVDEGFIAPERNVDGEPLYGFQDLVLLRTAKGLVDNAVAPVRVRRALKKLRSQLPAGRPLTSLRIVAEGSRLVVEDEASRWNPESGQVLFDFGTRAMSEEVAPLHRRRLHEIDGTNTALEDKTAQQWFELGCELELGAPAEARTAYERAIALDAGHAEARINLGRLLHEAGQLDDAEAHYRAAIAVRPKGTLAWFNLGLVLWAKGVVDPAVQAFELVIELDPTFADAHYNLSRLYESQGHKHAALRHLRQYKKLLDR